MEHKKTLFILNDPPYGTERCYNGLRLAGALAKRDDSDVRVFLMDDAVGCAMTNQKLPDGYYMLTKGTRRSTLDELTDWTLWADQTITF